MADEYGDFQFVDKFLARPLAAFNAHKPGVVAVTQEFDTFSGIDLSELGNVRSNKLGPKG